MPIDEAIDVLTEVSNFIGERSGQPFDFAALLVDPTTTPATNGVTIGPEYHPFARIAAPALRRFGGRYAELAARLEASIPEQRMICPRTIKQYIKNNVTHMTKRHKLMVN